MSNDLTAKLAEALRRCKRLVPVSSDEWAEADTALEEYDAATETPAEPVAWLYTLEYGTSIADRRVSLKQLRCPFGVCGADYLRVNDDGKSYVRETPLRLYDESKAQPVQESSICDSLPPLPHAVAHILLGDDSENVFTTDQMHAYARAALEQRSCDSATPESHVQRAPAPAPQPLTDEQILKLLRPLVWVYVEGHNKAQTLEDARAIEAAHGIGKEASK